VGHGCTAAGFLHVDDLAAGACFMMENQEGGELLNVGVGEDLTVAELAEKVARIVGYAGAIRFDPSWPDGTPRKLLDVSRIHSLAWRARISLNDGIASTYDWYCANAATAVAR